VNKLTQQLASLRGQLKGKSAVSGSADSLRVSYKEFWSIPPASAVGFYSFIPGNSGLARLDQFGQLYDLYRIENVRIEYRTSTGSTQSGMFHMGLDYDSLDQPSTVSGVTALNPVVSVPVWQNAQLRVQVDRAQRQKWLFTYGSTVRPDPGSSTGFSVATYSGLAQAGEIWCEYSVVFASPCISQSLVASQTSRGQLGVLMVLNEAETVLTASRVTGISALANASTLTYNSAVSSGDCDIITSSMAWPAQKWLRLGWSVLNNPAGALMNGLISVMGTKLPVLTSTSYSPGTLVPESTVNASDDGAYTYKTLTRSDQVIPSDAGTVSSFAEIDLSSYTAAELKAGVTLFITCLLSTIGANRSKFREES